MRSNNQKNRKTPTTRKTGKPTTRKILVGVLERGRVFVSESHGNLAPLAVKKLKGGGGRVVGLVGT
jgi:hypothetical protein